MIVFELNKQQHSLRHDWRDLTLSQAMQLRAIDLPEVADPLDWFEHIAIVRELASLMMTADPEHIPPPWLVNWHVRYWLPLWVDLRSSYPQTYTPKWLKFFEHGGKLYHLPERLELGDDVVLQHGQDAKRFVEASNLLELFSRMAKDGIKVAPLFIATVVREEGEGDFDEVRVAKRAERFNDLPMPYVWEVFFCTSEHLLKRMSVTLDYLRRATVIGEKPITADGYLRLPSQGLQEKLARLIS